MYNGPQSSPMNLQIQGSFGTAQLLNTSADVYNCGAV